VIIPPTWNNLFYGSQFSQSAVELLASLAERLALIDRSLISILDLFILNLFFA